MSQVKKLRNGMIIQSGSLYFRVHGAYPTFIWLVVVDKDFKVINREVIEVTPKELDKNSWRIVYVPSTQKW